MIPEIQELDRYLHDTMGVAMKVMPWNGAGHLPPVLRERYKFAKAELLGLPVLLMIDTGAEEQAPLAVRKHMEMLKTKQEAELVYVRGQQRGNLRYAMLQGTSRPSSSRKTRS